jgi:ABC-type bacteriocin/lantibiotic exporter with double-glycine peptidase domain
MTGTISKLSDLLDAREKRQALLLLALMLVLGLIEMAGVASIFPLIAVLSDPGLVEKNKYLRWLYDALGFSDSNSFFIFLSASVFLVVVVRIAFTATTNYALLRYAQMRSHTLSVKLLSSYLKRPYSWFLNRHSADLSKSILSEVEQVVRGSLMPALQFVSRFFIIVFIVGLVIAVEPTVAFSALSGMAIAYGLVYLTIRGYLRRKGQERLAANRARYQVAQEVLGGVKEVKIGGLELGYLRRFDKGSLRFARLKAQLQLVREVPRHMLELIAIGGMLIVILLLLNRAEGDISEVLPLLSLYAFASLRLLPAVQSIYQCVVSLRFGGPALEILHSELMAANEQVTEFTKVAPLPLKREITLENIAFAYAQAGRPALKDISLTIPVHSTVGIVGATGAGKSTLVDIILGLLEPQQGRLLVDGQAINYENVRAWQRTVGYVPQQIFLADESIAANIAFGVPPGKIDREAVERAARMAMLHDFIVDDLPRGYDTEVGERGVRLSGGQRQRVGIARALYHDPEVLVLDEATSALDVKTEQALMDCVESISGRKTLLIVAHRPETLRLCRKICVIERGRIKEERSGWTLPPSPQRGSAVAD